MSIDRLTAALADRYTIEHELGAGGMATVYLAEDLKHHRKVAVKVLRSELAAVLGAERFVQEIETTANLQHPHILPLFDSGEADSFLYYVMPFIDGESIRDRLNRDSQLGIEEAVQIARDVAEALDYAHRHGVIHRDIKPENILLQDGRPVVADFGIALAVSAAAGGRMTETGLSLGTPHYMSPEQATAEKDLSSRSDTYSLASVLYEMLSGEPPHMANTAQQIIMKIVTDEARPVTELRKSVPANVGHAISTALSKLPADRFESAAEFSRALGDAHYRSSHANAPDAAIDRIGRPVLLYVVAGLLMVVALLGWLRPTESGELPPVTRVSLRLPEDQAFRETHHVDLAPDGSFLVYVGPDEANDGQQLWIRYWDALDANPIRNTTGAQEGSISADGESVALVADFSIRVEPLSSGETRTVALQDVECCVRWSSDGMWLYYQNRLDGLSRVRPTGGDPEALTEVDGETDIQHAFLHTLAGGRYALMEAAGLFHTNPRIVDLDLTTGDTTVIMAGRSPVYRNGFLFYGSVDGTTLMAGRFDASRRELTGEPIVVAEGLTRSNAVFSLPVWSVSESGTLVFSRGNATVENVASWVNMDGTHEPVDSTWAGMSTPSLSPDGDRVAFSTASETVWVRSLLDGTLTALASPGGVTYRPSWSPDGEWVIFATTAGDATRLPEMYRVRADGVGDIEPLNLASPEAYYSPDGEWFVYRTYNTEVGEGDIMARRTSGDMEPITLEATGAYEGNHTISPDGRWLAYSSAQSGRTEVYVRPFPNADSARITVSLTGGNQPRWAKTKNELFYRDADGMMVRVVFRAADGFEVVSRTPLFDARDFRGGPTRIGYDIVPDDSRFLMIRAPEAADLAPIELILVQNVFTELEARAR